MDYQNQSVKVNNPLTTCAPGASINNPSMTDDSANKERNDAFDASTSSNSNSSNSTSFIFGSGSSVQDQSAKVNDQPATDATAPNNFINNPAMTDDNANSATAVSNSNGSKNDENPNAVKDAHNSRNDEEFDATTSESIDIDIVDNSINNEGSKMIPIDAMTASSINDEIDDKISVGVSDSSNKTTATNSTVATSTRINTLDLARGVQGCVTPTDTGFLDKSEGCSRCNNVVCACCATTSKSIDIDIVDSTTEHSVVGSKAKLFILGKSSKRSEDNTNSVNTPAFEETDNEKAQKTATDVDKGNNGEDQIMDIVGTSKMPVFSFPTPLAVRSLVASPIQVPSTSGVATVINNDDHNKPQKKKIRAQKRRHDSACPYNLRSLPCRSREALLARKW